MPSKDKGLRQRVLVMILGSALGGGNLLELPANGPGNLFSNGLLRSSEHAPSMQHPIPLYVFRLSVGANR